jgi:predicted adenine nucleotide alpha hydrolase (AANH) superfamily ATPase
MNILIHTCCGPCSIMPLELLGLQGHQLTAAWYNPNIQPKEEHDRRLATFLDYAAEIDVRVLFPRRGDFNRPDKTEGRSHPLIPNDPAYAEHLAARHTRCRHCYRTRFTEVARMAAQGGFDAIASTLTISPYQFTGIINEELNRAAAAAGIQAIESDWREHYQDATRRSRDAGMYRQNYCGCRYSQEEAALERAARKEQRKNAHR